MADLEYGVSEGVGTILLNRPERKNAFTLQMVDQWAQAIREARADPDVRVLVVTGAGDAFCSGVDLDDFTGERKTVLQNKTVLTERVHQVALALEDMDKPVLASVNGVAVGAGMDMALMCDIRLISESARFSEGYVRVGLVPGDGGCYFLPRLVGTAKALELLWTGDFVDSATAVELGIASYRYPDAELPERTAEFARKLAAGPPVAVRAIKRALYQSARCDLRTSLDLISSHQAIVQSTEDSAEALSAFREKRRPGFQGR
ncbi:crotonase/enoyl-CoA hydratase family protein [Saccharopolyspora gloriosae]|uniref:Enoyl-CoA hydratase/carnithine racemase n=1 Tax=Saccharopolyspora gloriosae TaxID=455344 RepID=A0A840NH94_9PSEU|nr:enoyl-CoA hydratase [Saccharopolyspora gloriosae]MBB5069445.1 enoyl-CoA hydratase/carnithine racemase [Saccharopolyspora gloriosae]